ncbi:MAG: hypothetical protein BWK80_40300 [Desulfobacteraceae bacterium IS3]|nr:MAG: hypothetical protein BWK80_40300 [Desulfobacteraceae bacterium IS3]HAO22140.1 hypothetical protein [Desulfobacteraceae bacterium]
MKNDRLFELYQAHKLAIREVKTQFTAEMEGPFLIAPSDAYWSSAVKVAFVGQETHGWSSVEDNRDQMQEYVDFNLGEKYYASPFWSVIRRLERSLTGSQFSSAWLNLNRFDQEGGAPSDENNRVLSELDFILIEELRIISPDVVIFFTGPRYDNRLFQLLPCVTQAVDGFSERQLCLLNSDVLPAKLFRTYHPNYLRRSGLETSVVEAISALARAE